MDIAVFLTIGLLAGIVGGFFGIGGGIVILPALIMLRGFSQKMAQGTSLVALIAPVGLLGLLNYSRENQVDWLAGGLIASGFFIGAYFGSKIALQMDPVTLRKGFSVFLVVVAVQLFFKK